MAAGSPPCRPTQNSTDLPSRCSFAVYVSSMCHRHPGRCTLSLTGSHLPPHGDRREPAVTSPVGHPAIGHLWRDEQMTGELSTCKGHGVLARICHWIEQETCSEESTAQGCSPTEIMHMQRSNSPWLYAVKSYMCRKFHNVPIHIHNLSLLHNKISLRRFSISSS